MILVTVGSSRCPFDRLLLAVGELAIDELMVAQCGATRVRPLRVTCVDYLHPAELERYVRQARVVVAHAGVGSVALCLRNGIRPVVVPRRRLLGENIDDHQVSFARRLAKLGLVTAVEDITRLREAIAAAPTFTSPRTGLSRRLADELAAYIARYATPDLETSGKTEKQLDRPTSSREIMPTTAEPA